MISIVDGTVVNVIGVDADAAIDGDGFTRLFAVVNASLHVDNITLKNGYAKYGGAIFASHSILTFGRTEFIGNNASNSGGAIHLSDGTTVSFGEESTFLNNIAFNGGALYVTGGSSLSWAKATTFSENIADWGGALYVKSGSQVSWAGEATFSYNKGGYGGAIYIEDNSDASWAGETVFNENIADDGAGGALCVVDGSTVLWTGTSSFLNNTYHGDGGGGGALYLENQSNATWTVESYFLANRAPWGDGGAIHANNGLLSWSMDVLFFNNTAKYGGALFVTDGSRVEWSGHTNFTSNTALSDGGAVGSKAFESSLSSMLYENDKESLVDIKGVTIFTNNTCEANGGALALVQSLAVSFDGGSDVTFSGNTAETSGGAVFISGTGIGPIFLNVIFADNSASTGGAVYATGSGTAVTKDGNNDNVPNPLTFDGCHFINNVAIATGGAVNTASGQDFFSRTSFEGNEARVGGALRLAGTASLVDCSFEENISELNEGPAVSNIGIMSNVTNGRFCDNVFNCEPKTFLDFNKSNDVLEAICDGCPSTCDECTVEEAQGAPTCTSLSEAGIKHATSEGGAITVEELQIDKGYWRATNTSRHVLECFNPEACTGGVTDAPNYCLAGYEGPYCSVCSKKYAPSLGFTCRKCSNRAVRIALATILTVVGVAVGVVLIFYLTSTQEAGAGRDIVNRVTRYVPAHSVKIIIVAWQILAQFASVTNVTFPNVYQKFLDGVDFLNFDLSWIVSTGCFVEFNFHHRLLWTTIAPFVAMCLLGVTYSIAAHRSRGLETALSNARQKHVSMALLIVFLVYSGVSSVAFQTFACDDLDDLEDGKKRYLRVDYTIECDSHTHRAYQIYAGFMILVYPVGIPLLYACLLFRNRRVLREKNGREESLVAKSTSDLWKPYKPHRFYYEVIECSRRILLTGAVVFFFPNTAAQIAVTLAIAMFFVFVSEALSPFESQWDAWISRTGHAVVLASMYLALLLRVDVSGEKDSSQKTFEAILVATHVCMVLSVIVEAVVMALALKADKHREDPRPRSRQSRYDWKGEISLFEEDACSKDELQHGQRNRRIGREFPTASAGDLSTPTSVSNTKASPYANGYMGRFNFVRDQRFAAS